jgi:hypothetical protein
MLIQVRKHEKKSLIAEICNFFVTKHVAASIVHRMLICYSGNRQRSMCNDIYRVDNLIAFGNRLLFTEEGLSCAQKRKVRKFRTKAKSISSVSPILAACFNFCRLVIPAGNEASNAPLSTNFFPA